MCPWPFSQKGFPKEGEPSLQVGGTVSAAGSWYEWKRERKPDERQHSSLLADGDDTVTNDPTLLTPCLPAQGAMLPNRELLQVFLSCAVFVKYFILLVGKVAQRETQGHWS